MPGWAWWLLAFALGIVVGMVVGVFIGALLAMSRSWD